jgi:hypothetical protein
MIHDIEEDFRFFAWTNLHNLESGQMSCVIGRRKKIVLRHKPQRQIGPLTDEGKGTKKPWPINTHERLMSRGDWGDRYPARGHLKPLACHVRRNNVKTAIGDRQQAKPKTQGSSACSPGMRPEALHRKRVEALVRLAEPTRRSKHTGGSPQHDNTVRADVSNDYTRRLHESGREAANQSGARDFATLRPDRGDRRCAEHSRNRFPGG